MIKRRCGITCKITSSLLCMVLFFLAVSTSAFFYLKRIKQNYRALSDRKLPASIAVSKLMQLSQRFMAYESIIIRTDSQLIREAQTKNFFNDICQSRHLLDILRATSDADKEVQDIAQHFTFLADNLNRLIDLSNRDARITDLQYDLLSRLRKLSKAFHDRSSVGTHPSQMETYLYDALHHQISILLQLHFETDKAAIAQWEQEFVTLCRKTDRWLQQWPILSKTQLSEFKTEIDSFGPKIRASSALRMERISIQHLIKENLVQNQLISSELEKRVDILLTAISKEVDGSWHHFNRMMHHLSIMIFVLPIILLFLGMVLLIYMRNSVIKRILALEKSMRSYYQGSPAQINTDGNDEIASMAKSVLHFIDTRDQYETSLNRTIAQTAIATQKLARGDLSARVDVLDDDPTRYLSLSFNQMADRIESLIISQRHLFQAVSHELRTPLSRIAFHLEMIIEERQLEQRKHLCEEIAIDIDELDNLVKELLLYSKFSSHPIELVVEPIQLPDALNRMITRQNSTNRRIIEIDIQTTAKDTIELSAQPFFFKLAIQNLLSNAVQYAFSKVWIRYDRVTMGVRIEVCDDGPGIPLEKRNLVFEPFTRIDRSRDRKTGGAGLGLAIVKRILERHSGTVSILDNDGQGTRIVTFWPSKIEE